MRGARSSYRRGVTLLEIVLALGLLVSLTSMTYWFYASCLESRRTGTVEAQKLRLVRVVLDRITTEIRQVAAVTRDYGVGLRGAEEQIWLTSLRVPGKEQAKDYSFRKEPPPGEYDLVKVEYKIARHREILHEDGWELPLGLARIGIRIPRPDSAETGEAFEDEGRISAGEDAEAAAEAKLLEELLEDEEGEGRDVDLGPQIDWEELYAPEIHYLRFCYYDGHAWWDNWEVGGENPLPQLVMVTLGYDSHPPYGGRIGEDEINEEFCECLNQDPVDCEALQPDQYSTVVRLPPADPLFRSRVTRETQALVEQAGQLEAQEEEEP